MWWLCEMWWFMQIWWLFGRAPVYYKAEVPGSKQWKTLSTAAKKIVVNTHAFPAHTYGNAA